MTQSKFVPTHSILRSYLFSNTPRFLYRKLRGDESVKAFADKNSPEDLVAELTRLFGMSSLSAEETALAYALIVALTYLPLGEARKALDEVAVSTLTWGNDIVSIFGSTASPTSKVSLTVPTPAPQILRTTSTSSSSTSAFDFDRSGSSISGTEEDA